MDELVPLWRHYQFINAGSVPKPYYNLNNFGSTGILRLEPKGNALPSELFLFSAVHLKSTPNKSGATVQWMVRFPPMIAGTVVLSCGVTKKRAIVIMGTVRCVKDRTVNRYMSNQWISCGVFDNTSEISTLTCVCS